MCYVTSKVVDYNQTTIQEANDNYTMAKNQTSSANQTNDQNNVIVVNSVIPFIVFDILLFNVCLWSILGFFGFYRKNVCALIAVF
jgi:hypothetical protein